MNEYIKNFTRRPLTCSSSSFKMASHRSFKTPSYFTTGSSSTSNRSDTSKRPHIKSSYPSSSSSDEDIIASLKDLALQPRTKEVTSTSSSTKSSPRCDTSEAHGM